MVAAKTEILSANVETLSGNIGGLSGNVDSLSDNTGGLTDNIFALSDKMGDLSGIVLPCRALFWTVAQYFPVSGNVGAIYDHLITMGLPV